ncbi:MAG: pyridoxal-phosphate dependent enzyme [Mycobacteriales bacterium]
MSRYTGRLRCVRCSRSYPETSTVDGCPACREVAPSALLPEYDQVGLSGLPVRPEQPGLFRYRELLPLPDEAAPVSLDEGGTPLRPLTRTGERLGIDRLLLKDETRNPTWSYKDRLAAVAITAARHGDADTVVVSTTGNHGAAVAAYAAAARLRCVVLTVASVPQTMKTLMQVYGAEVVAVDRATDRWVLMQQLVRERGWWPMSGYRSPPVGSTPFGVDGYKTIAYEVVEQLGAAPDVVVVPTAYADGLAGIVRGFRDLLGLGLIGRLPRAVVTEPFGPYREALRTGADTVGPVPVRPSVAFSIASPVGTFQGLDALRVTAGTAVAVPDDDRILDAQAALGRDEGTYLEAASVTGLVGVGDLRAAGEIRREDVVVVIGTSSGLKDVGTTASRQPPVPVIAPTLQALDEALGGVRS